MSESISKRVKSLGFPLNQLIVVGSAVLEVLGLRQAGDIDMVGADELLSQLEKDSSWKKHFHADGSYVFLRDDFEIGNNWLKDGGDNNFDELLDMGTFLVEKVRFVNPVVILKWKYKNNRPKDQADIKLIESYLQNH